MSDKPKTAVQWLIENLDIMGIPLLSDEKELCKQALAMERESMIEFAKKYEDYSWKAYQNNRYVPPMTTEQYYTETYGE
jgi:hypothetical protein